MNVAKTGILGRITGFLGTKNGAVVKKDGFLGTKNTRH
jgi:hypothetical protein